MPGWHSEIEMTAEDVVIEILESGRAEITAGFLFTNNGDAESVILLIRAIRFCLKGVPEKRVQVVCPPSFPVH